MPSLTARIVGLLLRTTGYYRRMYSGGALFQKNLARVRAARQAEPTAKMRRDLTVKQSQFDGQSIWYLAPNDREPSAHVLYWHGGGYVYPATPAHWAFLARMAQVYGWAITAPLYPLAPEFNAEHTTSWALKYYQHYLDERGGAPFVMGGDSAGGGLAAATVLAARAHWLALPAALLLICPWLNTEPSHPDQKAIEPRDAILTLAGISEAGALYADGLPATDPRVSPIYADWTGLPPILAFGGGDDILVCDARALKVTNPSIEYCEEAGMIHDWPLFSFTESRAAQKQMSAFVSSTIT
ncbi:MAG: alpha/beta hydrolase [Sphingorhabdus sp.]